MNGSEGQVGRRDISTFWCFKISKFRRFDDFDDFNNFNNFTKKLEGHSLLKGGTQNSPKKTCPYQKKSVPLHPILK